MLKALNLGDMTEYARCEIKFTQDPLAKWTLDQFRIMQPDVEVFGLYKKFENTSEKYIIHIDCG